VTIQRPWRLGRVAALAAVAVVAAAGSLSAEECGTCHPEERVAYARSIHRSESVTCVSCHGGDAESRSVDTAHGGNFRELTDRAEQPAMCAECHSDIERMRAYNLPIDQYALYQTSRHGQALERGDTRVAVCADCHGAHDVVRVDDPESPAGRRQIATTCSRCHGDPELMAIYGLDSGTPDDYRQSVHGQALLAGGNLAAPNCTDCHGVHGATPPAIGNVEKICGSCHVDTRLAFDQGPHRAAMQAADLPECASCHSNHAIRRFERADLDDLCTECHDGDSAENHQAAEIVAVIDTAESEVDAAEELVDRARAVPLPVEDYQSRIEEARTYLTEGRTLVHTVSVDKVQWITQRAQAIGLEVQSEVLDDLDPTNRLLVLAAFWFYLLMTLAILVVYKRRLRPAGSER